MKTIFTCLVVATVLLSACNTKSSRSDAEPLSHQSEITISGAYALAPLMQLWVTEFTKTHTYVKFTIKPNGSDQGQRDILLGKVDIAMLSSDIPKEAENLLQVVPVARLGVVPIISAQNPFLTEISKKGISREDLASLFTNDHPKTWGDLYGKPQKDPVKVYIRADSSGSTKVLAKYLWVERNEIRGTAIDGEVKLVEAVKNDPLALGYCNFIYALDPAKKKFSKDVCVIPIDFNSNGVIDWKEKIFENSETLQRAMWLGKFPCSLIRSLYMVTKGKPKTREVAEFLYWVITDGQQFVADNGYIELHSSEVQFLVNSLKVNSK